MCNIYFIALFVPIVLMPYNQSDYINGTLFGAVTGNTAVNSGTLMFTWCFSLIVPAAVFGTEQY